jgi:DNA-binding GntR family transcriptional regulator
MRSYIDEFVAARDTMTPQDQLALARRFDHEIAVAAANPALRSLIDSFAIYGADYRLRTLDRDVSDNERVERRVAEHRAILEALAAADEDAAERLMRAHARSATELS